jgi:flagellin-like hook-associated protein FlgL
MSSDVVLTAALRNNLLSLQGTQKSIDATQIRLSTGKKVNSALDNPQSFFASKALQNRASDLSKLLDSIGQSVQVIKAADQGVTAVTKLVEQAQAVAETARSSIASAQAEAKVVGTVDLRGVDDLDTLSGVTDNDTLVLSITDSDGAAVNIGAYGGAAAATATVTLDTSDSIEEFMDEINNIHLQVNGAGNAVGDHAFEASLDSSGHLQIKSLNGGDFNINFVAATNNDTNNLALASALGFSGIARLVADDTAAANNNVEVTAISDVALTSFALYDNTVPASRSIAQRGDILTNITKSDGTALFGNNTINEATDKYQIGINGGTMQDIFLYQNGGAITIQEFVDGINNNSALNTKIQASFDDDTGVISIKPIDASVTDIQVGAGTSVAGVTANFGFGSNQAIVSTGTVDEAENIHLGASAGNLAGLESDYSNILSQIDELVSNGDTGYRGTNLLNGDDLETFFNESRSSSLKVNGAKFDSASLGLEAASFTTTAKIDSIIEDTRNALNTVRDFGSSLANSLTVIQTRQDFTTNLIDTLTAGADLLVNADQNEEGAKLLSLQTRQQLGVTALSLASQSQQSILRLF